MGLNPAPPPIWKFTYLLSLKNTSISDLLVIGDPAKQEVPKEYMALVCPQC